ncbi:DNA-processing protein DprA [Luteitalea sp.]|uniref:DNA-processing protein DprA n=1 Tax=Luteitalea sp. TaxID=2004800 RepID=UPI000AE46EA6|nr:DNA-processing protein DprA [Luteitalea sp.]
MSDPSRLDAVALALAAGTQPARAAATLKAALPSWPALPLSLCLDALTLHGPGAVEHWRAEAGRALAIADAAGYDVLWPAHHAYPPLLRTIVDPPLLLWVWGDVALLAAPAVALVGSRRATTSGSEVAFRIAADLAAAGVVVASGFARGIDAAAHRGALSTGRSVAVLGCGLDQPYPSDHGPLGRQLAETGAVISEFPPGTPPLAHHFPLRNRTLSGLCHAVVVVQATERSGSLITARLAMEQGREVMAVPGDVRTGANSGGHALLRDGARLVERAADVLEELGWVASPETSEGEASVGRARSPSGPTSSTILTCLAREDGVTLDDLLAETGRNPSDLLEELLDLELAGRVRRDGAGRFLPAERKW